MFKIRVNFGLFLIIIFFFSCINQQKKQLPVYNPVDFKAKLVDKSVRNVSENHTVAEFSLINPQMVLI